MYNRVFGSEKSPFELLSYTSDTIPFLLAIFEANPALIHEIPAEQLLGLNTEILLSPLAHFLADENGRKLLKLLCAENSSLKQGIMMQIFSSPMLHAVERSRLPGLNLYFDKFDKTGVSETEYNDLRDKLVGRYDVVFNHFSDVRHELNLSYFYLLVFYDSNYDLLNYFLENDNDSFIKEVKFNDLCYDLNERNLKYFDGCSTPLYHLSLSIDGLKVLKKLMMQNPSLPKEEVSIEHLEKLITFYNFYDESGKPILPFEPNSHLAHALKKDPELLALFCKNKIIKKYLAERGLSIKKETSLYLSSDVFFSPSESSVVEPIIEEEAEISFSQREATSSP